MTSLKAFICYQKVHVQIVSVLTLEVCEELVSSGLCSWESCFCQLCLKILSTIFWIALQLNGKMYIVTFTTIGEAKYTSGVCRQVGELVQNG